MTARLVDDFLELKATTACPFAANAAIEVGAVCGTEAFLNVPELAVRLQDYLHRFRTEKLDGYAWAVEGASASTLEGTVSLFARTLAGLANIDPAPPAVPWDLIESAEWQFSHAGERLFLNVFSPCYPVGHTKHLPHDDGIMVFAQPEDAFSFCGVDQSRHALKEDIRRRFAELGNPYDGALIDERIEAQLYVFPLTVGDGPVRWWDHASIVALRGRR